MSVFEGGCECGAVRYRMTTEPIFVNCCHCRDCQKITGSAFAINAMIESDRLELLSGEDELLNEGQGSRCPRCNGLLWGAHRLFGDRVKFLRVGTLDEAERIRPDAHFFIRSKHPWVTIPADVPAYDALPADRDPPAMSAETKARLEAVRRS
jgi:hypothetical protein